MKLKTILTAMLALVTMTGQAKVFKTIKAPEAMSCVNVAGDFFAREVVFADTATTVQFTMKCQSGHTFQFVSASYLMDENGKRYALRSCEGIKLNTWVTSPESGITQFTMHFEPLPKKVQIFDFIEGDGARAFMLLGIHDKKAKFKVPTLKELRDANPYSVPADWFTTDTITIKGRIEGYNAEQFGFTTMECFYEDVFEKDDATLVLDIAADGSFCKKFQASYPIRHKFRTYDSKVGFSELPFFARPGETIDITVKKNAYGQYECFYNNGSSKEVERLLKGNLKSWDLVYPLARFKGKFSEVGEVAERTWNNMLYRLQLEGRRFQLTPQEMQLAIAEQQVCYAEAVMDYAMNHESDVMKYEQRNGVYYSEITDSAEWLELSKIENYKSLHRVDFNNPLMLTSSSYPITVNRIQYADAVRKRMYAVCMNEEGAIEMDAHSEKKMLEAALAGFRELMGSKDDNLMAQICTYKNMLSNFNSWRSSEEFCARLLADTTQTEGEVQIDVASISSLSNMMPLYIGALSHAYVHHKAEAFYAAKMAQTELSTPLPDNNPAADLIRSISAKYPGRFLIIDFWGMGCGPCRAAIQSSKSLRAEIAKRDDVKLVFIAGERISGGSEGYKKYVAEWLANEEAICIPDAEFTRLQELFRFNGIPHYEAITPDCRRVRDDLQPHGFYNFDYDMKQLTEKLK